VYLDLLARVSLSVAGSRQVSDTLRLIVDGLVNEVGFALARIWLVQTADRDERQNTLVLRASAGRSVAGEEWTSLQGRFSRFPLGERKIGRVGLTGEPVLIEDLAAGRSWVADPVWAAREAMMSFAAHPLVFQGEVTGVLGVFSRQRMSRQELAALRVFADHAAVSLANARAFEELHDLRRRLELENTYLQEEVREAIQYHNIVGHSTALAGILEQVELVAPTDASVLIFGESGTGKELVARAIHDRSRRKSRPLIKVNCASVPKELFESEFFGHVRGSFTGAVKDRVGRFQLADRGSLFLDEVGEIPLDLQAKLLRVLQEGEFERVGDEETRRVDVRVIAATNRNLSKEVEERRFREDLYYRLSVFPIVVPPLRERKDDIPLLTIHFVRNGARRMRLPEPRLTEEDLRILTAYDWPGNIRELQHVIERAVILGRGRTLRLDLPARASAATADSVAAFPVGSATAGPKAEEEPAVMTAEQLRLMEITNYRNALKRAGGRIYGAYGAAALLGIPPTTLASRLKALGIQHE
jgi:transcriptional regulator with GAF, ATPase, and Fis domain